MTEPLSIRFANSVIDSFTPDLMKWHYQDGLIVYSIYNIGDYYGIQKFKDWAVSMYEALISADGTIKTYRTGEYNLDQINCGRPLFDFYAETKDERYLKAAEHLKEQLNTQPRTKNDIFWHKEIYPWQVWLDGLYMQGPFWTRCGHFEDVQAQLVKVYSIMKDSKTGLLYHAWDESKGMRWADENTGLSPHFWSRSIGWYLMSCLDCLEYAPEGFEELKSQIKTIVKNLLKAVSEFQDENGMWYQVPDYKEETGNYHETSGSSMFCYAGFKAARLGITDDYVKMAEKGMKGICDKYLSEEGTKLHLGGICSVAGLGGNPYRDGSLSYYFSEPVVTDDFKGTGPFVLACLESEKQTKRGNK